MKLSVIIVNYNVKYLLEQCLLSVTESNVDFDYEIIVVDNNSTDGSLDYLQPRFPDVTFIANADNPGFSKANNQAYKLAKGEYVLLLNPDTVIGENTLQHTCDFLDAHLDVGAVGVKMINGSGEFQPESKRGFPTPWASFCKLFKLTRLFPRSRTFGRYNLTYLDENEAHEVEILVGSFMLIESDVIRETGLLDESFFMYGEDIDLSYRITQAGYKNYYLPETIIHYKGESTKTDDIRYVKTFYEAMYIFFKKHNPNYGKLYSLFIPVGIFLTGFISAGKHLLKKTFRIRKKEKEIVILDHSIYTYQEIIRQMDKNKDKNKEYRIYSPRSGMIIGSHYAEIKASNDA